MPDEPGKIDESGLRTWMHETPVNAASVDAGSVIRTARRRRRASRLSAGAIGALTVVALATLGITALQKLPGEGLTTTAAEDSDSGVSVPESVAGADDNFADRDASEATARTLHRCGNELTRVKENSLGLVLTTDFPDSVAFGAREVEGIVTMTNAGPRRIVARSAAGPVITLSRDDITVWHTHGTPTSLTVQVDLEPGESMTYRSQFTPVVCDIADELEPSFPLDLPAAEPGNYALRAAIDLVMEGADGNVLVTGPAEPVSIR